MATAERARYEAGTPPTATYRLQLSAAFTFADAAAAVAGIAAQGFSHLYLSPILQAAPGSTHGYDVVDHGRVSDALGGEDGLVALAGAAHAHGLGIVVDVVPNHVALPTPESLNPRLWSLLRDGPSSESARWFDLDWSAQEGSILLAVLGDRIGRCLAAGQITLDGTGAEPVVRYADHVLPVRPGTEGLPLPELLDAQWYRLAHWRVAEDELNYRRFFDVDTLAGVRAEDPQVFDAMHSVLLRLHREGVVDGFRIDHPDGLADPRGYLRRLAEGSAGAWVVVEKILEGDEQLPGDWPCAGTTGYEAIAHLMGTLTDPAGEGDLRALWLAREDADATFAAAAEHGKRDVLAGSLRAEVNRLVEEIASVCQDDLMLRDLTRRGLEEALVELLVAFPVYRAYVTPGEPPSDTARAVIAEAVDAARERLPERADEIEAIAALIRADGPRDARRDAVCVRFQQTTGPVMAKGVEDTALYRWLSLTALNEVGGDPGRVGASPDRLHAWAEDRATRHPWTLNALSTHDTKRSEDVRARLVLLAEDTAGWTRLLEELAEAVAPLRPPGEPVHPGDEYLLWQTAVGAWPIGPERMLAYLMKALREAKRRTSWTAPDTAYEEALALFVERVLADPGVCGLLQGYVDGLAAGWRANVLTQTLLHRMLPGVPDVYRGTEVVDLSLVDPDNRRPVDHDGIDRRRERLDAGGAPSDLADEKLRVSCAALRLRRRRPEWFSGTGAGYLPVATGSAHAVGMVRGGHVVAVGTRLPLTLARSGGWGPATLALPPGAWRDVLSAAGARLRGAVPLAHLLAESPVALLVREDVL